MPTTVTSRELNQDVSGAKKAAEKGPVFITDRGRPAHVLLSIDDYYTLIGEKPHLAELIGMPHADENDFEPGSLSDLDLKPADLR